ncbi:hypothetical protein RUM44_002397 [Polyplax serrata]|uniref:Uncharacterized protein n=1 Tax=Polyplax serrata TaxID=468196 RepID=A0ABR1AEN3_POLSC
MDGWMDGWMDGRTDGDIFPTPLTAHAYERVPFWPAGLLGKKEANEGQTNKQTAAAAAATHTQSNGQTGKFDVEWENPGHFGLFLIAVLPFLDTWHSFHTSEGKQI